jgi:N-acetyl-anhydromuramyl-L-alanine amidase AmpD
MTDRICPNCGSTIPADLAVNGQDLTMHHDLRGVARAVSSYVDSPHRSRGLTPVGIVIHYMAGTYKGSIGWFQNPVSKVSAHFMMAKDGQWTQMVPLPDPDPDPPRDGRYQAWHCKGGNPRYIGIEHEGHGGVDEWTDDMLNTSSQMAAYLCSIYDIPIVGPPGPPGHREWFVGLGGHDNVPGNNHTDPGSHFPWKHYISLVEWYSSGRVDAPPARQYPATQP